MTINTDGFYVSRKYEGRVGLPTGIHNGGVLYDISEKVNGKDIVTSRHHYCSEEEFSRRYK